jgi:N-acetylglutamate synthase-like GNAT family acetyltransferase
MNGIKKISRSDREWMKSVFREYWGCEIVVSKGKVHSASEVDGYIVFSENKKVGLITYQVRKQECEIVTLNSFVEGQGFGTSLVAKVKSVAENLKCRRLWLVTTNDNIDALRFWQRRGFSLVYVHRHAIQESRKIKPEIPKIGQYGIPIQDEIEMEIKFST